MALTPGTRLGVYEIVAPIGAGGMGEVYRATDTRLKRQVAIKILPEPLAADTDQLARFQREAEVLASLNHPHIAAIYGLEETAGTTALVMELVEGDDLSQLIAGRTEAESLRSRPRDSEAAATRGGGAPRSKDGLEIGTALAIARQIAEALEAAHEQGIIHRDLKPANIKVREDGTVKVLDFGLAKALDQAPEPGPYASAGATNSPTLTTPAMTDAGMIMGTAPYMSPEQARGATADKRADLWAFGVVLWEMLTANRLFEGPTVSDTLAAVLRAEPEWAALPADTPASIRRLLRRCLEKDRKRRLDSAAAARLDIEEALSPAASADGAAAQPLRAMRSTWSRGLPWSVAAAALAVIGLLAWRGGADRAPSPPLYASLEVPTDYVLGEDDFFVSLPTRTPIVFTPDGRSLVMEIAKAGKPQLFLRPLDRQDAKPIAGTADAHAPFVSPDGKWVAFTAGNELRKVPIEGGTPTTICSVGAGALGVYGAAWGAGDVIVFGDPASGGIVRVSANGGTPVPVTTAPPPWTRRNHVAPTFLPDGQRILFSDVAIEDASDARLMVQAISGGEPRLVVSPASDGRVMPSGQLIFLRLGRLMVVPFDVRNAQINGEPVVALTDVMQTGVTNRSATFPGAGMFAVSSLGTLAIVRGGLITSSEGRLVWMTRDGGSSAAEPKAGAPAGGRSYTRVAADGSRAIVAVPTPVRIQLWIADWIRDVWTLCGDCSSEYGEAVWSPDGRHLLLGHKDTLVAHTLDGSEPDQVLVRDPGHTLWPNAWLPDGKIVYAAYSPPADAETKLLEPGSRAGRVVATGQGDAAISPDGHWLAHSLTRPGQPGNVVVQAFPGPGAQIQVSAGGGLNPVWSPDGRTLYYLATGSTVLAVDVVPGADLRVGTPRKLFSLPRGQGCGGRCYDISHDGRFLVRTDSDTERASVRRMDLVLNWTSTLPDAKK